MHQCLPQARVQVFQLCLALLQDLGNCALVCTQGFNLHDAHIPQPPTIPCLQAIHPTMFSVPHLHIFPLEQASLLNNIKMQLGPVHLCGAQLLSIANEVSAIPLQRGTHEQPLQDTTNILSLS